MRSEQSNTAADRRTDALFSQHPQVESVRLSSGVLVKAPFHAYDADAYIFAGMVDSTVALHLLQNAGLKPITSGSSRAYAEVWVTDYRDTGLGSCGNPAAGAYTEAAVILVASFHAKNVRWRNQYSPLRATAVTGALRFPYQLVLSDEASLAIAYGREILGLDKRPGTVLVDAETPATRFRVHDAKNLLILEGSIAASRNLGFLGVAQLVAALGPIASLKLAARRISRLDLATLENVSSQSTVVIRRGYLKRTSFPKVHGCTGSNGLTVGRESELGKTLAELAFQPTVSVTVTRFMGVLGTRAVA